MTHESVLVKTKQVMPVAVGCRHLGAGRTDSAHGRLAPTVFDVCGIDFRYMTTEKNAVPVSHAEAPVTAQCSQFFEMARVEPAAAKLPVRNCLFFQNDSRIGDDKKAKAHTISSNNYLHNAA